MPPEPVSREVTVRHEAGVTILTLHSEDRRNLLTPTRLDTLRSALEEAVDDRQCRVILLRSAHRDFCYGMDLTLLSQRQGTEQTGTRLARAVKDYAGLLQAIHCAPKPVVCVVAGQVRAGGIGLVAACDIVYAAPQAQFEMGEVLFGLIPANVLPYVCGVRLSPHKARYLVMTARRLSAAEAHALQLVDEVCEIETMDRQLRALCRQLLRAAPEALAETKRFTREILWRPTDEASRLARTRLPQIAMQPATRDALAAFGEGLTPDWFRRYKPTEPLFETSSDE